MAKSNVEKAIKDAIDLLEDIDSARRRDDDEKLKRLSRDADDAARDLKRALDEMRSGWDE
jgi:hypothetical protein